jgi:hemerythrin superfamily protein
MRKKASRRTSNRGADALTLLKEDHTKVEGLFDQFEKTRTDDRQRSLAAQICRELKVHTTIEEEIFYPAVREAIDDDDLMDEAAVEHGSAKELIEQIESGSPRDDKWSAKVCVLGEYIRHHVKEEQTEIFPEVRKSNLDLQELGGQLRARKRELMNGEGAGRSRRAGMSQLGGQAERM